jgi:hypothetical protein
MTASSRRTAVAAALSAFLTAERSKPFGVAQEVLDDAHSLLARLNLPQPARDQVPTLALTRQELSDAIDEKLCVETWNLVHLQAKSLADIVTKVRYVQELTQIDDTDVESQITLSLCRDIVALARAISDKA